MIKIENMSMIYPNGKGVFDINLHVKKGEVFGFLGPNGAGKTTTIRQLMGFTNASEGRCFINGLDTRKETEVIQRDLGYLPGEITFFDNMTGDEFLAFLTALRGEKTDKRKDELLKYFELDSDSAISKMSKGMKQKLGLVAAFMHGPDILILDEPTSGLDPLMQRKFINLIREEKNRGKTILLSSHMFEEVDRTCSRAAIIKEGRIVVTEDITTLKKNLKKSFLVTFGKKEDIDIVVSSGLENNKIEDLKLEIFVSDQYKEFFHTLNQCDVTSLDVVEQSLEQVFIGYYGKEEA